MRNILHLIIGILLINISFPNKVLAYSNWGGDIEIFSIYDVFFDILSFSVTIVALGIGVQMLNKLSGGLKSVWLYCMIAILLFVVMQILSLLSVFDIFRLSGLFAIIKFFMSIVFLATVFSARSFIQKILRNKSAISKNLGSIE